MTNTNATSEINPAMKEVVNHVTLDLKIISGLFYSISFVLGVGSNVLVLLVIIYFQRIRVVTNFFILTLAISDLIFVLLCIPSTYVTAYLMTYWPFPAFLCIFFNFMQTVSVTITVYTLIWITLDKFWALCKPLKLRMGHRFSRYLILGTWMFGLVTSLPIALYTQLVYNKSADASFISISTEQNSTLLIDNVSLYLNTILNIFTLSILKIERNNELSYSINKSININILQMQKKLICQ